MYVHQLILQIGRFIEATTEKSFREQCGPTPYYVLILHNRPIV